MLEGSGAWKGVNEGGLPLDADDEDELGLAGHVEVAFLLR